MLFGKKRPGHKRLNSRSSSSSSITRVDSNTVPEAGPVQPASSISPIQDSPTCSNGQLSWKEWTPEETKCLQFARVMTPRDYWEVVSNSIYESSRVRIHPEVCRRQFLTDISIELKNSAIPNSPRP